MARRIDQRTTEWKEMQKQAIAAAQQKDYERQLQLNAKDILEMLSAYKTTKVTA